MVVVGCRVSVSEYQFLLASFLLKSKLAVQSSVVSSADVFQSRYAFVFFASVFSRSVGGREAAALLAILSFGRLRSPFRTFGGFGPKFPRRAPRAVRRPR